MVNGNELRGIALTILNVLEGGKVKTLHDLKQLVGMKIPFPKGDIFEIHQGDSGSLLDIKQAIKISYIRPDWGAVISTSSNQEDNFTKFYLKTTAEVFGYTAVMEDSLGRTIYEQVFPRADFEVLRKELNRLSDRKFYITE